ncbi:hypothetical protein GFS24_06450 [Chitinophaga sp. SYP-B3965]|uniref:hypothetical protein n=1 Tax=Chitinophaga sp. SYP-B3965 TaxID=2663120 RepID=UPI001299A3A0|nr:hypothetical protein [Chitinophaga sp. SYP-B3965]MRG44745.1 hypothetical protein [Chitinophaga sp. SYP-B3965]
MQRKLGTINTPENLSEIINLLAQKGLPMPRPEIARWIKEVFEVKENAHPDNMLERVFASIDNSTNRIILDDERDYADDTDDLRMK